MYDPDPASQQKHLVKHFFWRFFDLEAITTPQTDVIQKNALTIRILACLIFPGVLGCIQLCAKYAWLKGNRPAVELYLAALSDKCFFLSLSMILLGFIAVYEWEMLLPDLKDYLILTPLPIRTRMIFFAKINALSRFLLIFIVAINACPTVLLPNAILVNNAPFFYGLGYMACHGLSVLLSSGLIFLSAIAVQGSLLMLFPANVALSISRRIRFFCLMLLLCALIFFPGIRSIHQSLPGIGPIAPFWPPIWFVGVYEVLLGSRDPVMLHLAGRAVIALSLTGTLCILTYASCYRRFMRSSIELGSGDSRRATSLRTAGNFLLDRCFMRKSEDRASFHFAGQTLFRSPRHVLYIGIFLAIGISAAIIAAMELMSAAHGKNPSMAGRLDEALLLGPRLLAFFLLVGMRVCFTVPVDLDANWLFRLCPKQQIKDQHRGVRKFLIGGLIVPLYLFSGLFYLLIWDWHTVLMHFFYGVTLSLVLMELLFIRFEKIPFTCSYLPGDASRVFLWPLYGLGFAYYVFASTTLEAWVSGDTHSLIYYYAITGALWLVLLYRNLLSADRMVYFEEESASAPVYLDMRS
jgi:hypothetical protein